MKTPKLIPFRSEHLTMFVDLQFRIIPPSDSTSFSIVLEGDDGGQVLVGCMGIGTAWPGFGVAWAIFTDDIRRYPVWLTRTSKRMLQAAIRTLKLYRVEIVVSTTDKRAQQWAETLGFYRENGMATNYSPKGDDVFRYEKICGRSQWSTQQ